MLYIIIFKHNTLRRYVYITKYNLHKMLIFNVTLAKF